MGLLKRPEKVLRLINRLKKTGTLSAEIITKRKALLHLLLAIKGEGLLKKDFFQGPETIIY